MENNEEIINSTEINNLVDKKTSGSKADYNIKLENLIKEEEIGWQKKIKTIIKLVRSKEPEDMIEGQALGLSYRMELLEKNQYYLGLLVKEEKIYKKLKTKRICIYLTGRQMDGSGISAIDIRNPLIAHQKISNNQRDYVISGELVDFEECIEMIKNTLSFNTEVIKTIDNYMFMVKNRLELFNLFK